MSALAEATGSVNLGQGFPDYDGPPEVLDAARAAIAAGPQPVPAGAGHRRRSGDAIAEHQRRYYGLEVDPDTEVLVTAGATEALAAAILALCEVGDEVVFFEPYYDAYPALAAMAGAGYRVVPLRPPRLGLRPRRAGPGGHAPHPAGRSSTRPTTRRARCSTATSSRPSPGVCIEHDLLAVTDEVYEHLVFEGEHLPLAVVRGHGRAHRDHLLGRQDLLGHRLEDRLGLRHPRRWSARCRRPSSSSPSPAAPRSSTRWRPGSPSPDATGSPRWATTCEIRRDLFCAGLATSASRC